MYIAVAAPIVSTLLGGLLGSKNKAPQTTESKAPWAPAQPYLTQNLADNKTLQDYYQQNPFNAQQKQGYQNVFGDIDNMRQNVAPGLLSFANNMMTGSYQRPQHSRPGTAGYGGAQAPDQTAGGLLSAGNNRPGPFQMQQQPGFGQVDYNATNAFYKSPEQVAQAKVDAALEAERQRMLAAQQQAPQAWSPSDNKPGYI